MKLINVIASLVSLGGVTSAGRLHAAHHGLLQISPSFSGDGVSMYPALHPSHDAMDLNHLIPQLNGDLYFSQEGHRREYIIHPMHGLAANPSQLPCMVPNMLKCGRATPVLRLR
ncbi:hypothetical protein BDV59DRAFT_30344 [Aspergillus ambiguus]|uniref:uncharacterized protein n=1 Tax=Aspergillus ambiguus TaxID=176160 RepID=UPI003CCC9232